MLALLAYVAVAEQGAVVRAFRAIGGAGLAVAALMAVSSGAFIIALNYAPVANVLFMQALAPILAAALGTLLGEPVPARTWTAMTIALAGVALMVGGPGGHPHVLGEGMALLMSIAFAGTLVITRRRRDVSMAPATCLSQVAVLFAAAPFAHPAGGVGSRDLLLLAALGIGQIGLGLIFLTIGARLIPAAEVALITLLEIVLGPLWVWLVQSEQPSAATLAGGAIVLGAVALQARAGPAPGSTVPPPP
ncbi:MAG: hypothetical protein QOH02_361 [Gaiellaceae bacterium]|nr:hypothetical protein [Gaiellaceae bacterium]MDX6492426.1 hypothetical protein [Gaiellaceae bacterium]